MAYKGLATFTIAYKELTLELNKHFNVLVGNSFSVLSGSGDQLLGVVYVTYTFQP
jgi:hypothetical protein